MNDICVHHLTEKRRMVSFDWRTPCHDASCEVAMSTVEIILKAGGKYTVRDLWAHTQASGDGTLKVSLEPHATAMYRISNH